MNKTTDDMQSVPLVFYSDWMEIINELPDDQQLKVYKALTAYAFNGEMPDDPVIRAITALMFKFIDRDRKKYQRAKEQRRNAAKKRWDSRKDGEPSATEECARTAPDADGIHNHNNINIKHKHENINNRQQGCNSVCAHEEPRDVMVYGMVHTPLIDLISERYASRRFTIFTTNLDTDQIREKYGARIYDRLKECCTSIVFSNDSYRGRT